MTPEQIERAVGRYLRRGRRDENEAVGDVRRVCTCPVARALQPSHDPWVCVNLPRYSHWFGSGTSMYSSVQPGWITLSKGGVVTRPALTPRIARFAALVDNEPGPTVTRARARELWQRAKGGSR